jgi:glycosyltransferase involved in cell wall biosynthesis
MVVFSWKFQRLLAIQGRPDGKVSALSDLTVSIVIPTYNRARLLERALGSAVRECRPGDEILVVDDGSTDDTEAVVRASGPAVRYLTGEHRGAGAARNAGIKAATGDLVAFLDSDDEWIPGKLSWQRTVLEQFPDVLFLFSDFGRVTRTNERLGHQLSQVADRHGDVRPWSSILGPGISSAIIAGMPSSAPPFMLHVGRLYETLIHFWCVWTCTVIARKDEAGDALHFAEDVPTFEDFECFALLASRGLAGYMDCDTAWNHGHSGARLTNADQATRADVAVKLTNRVWGADEEYLRLHRDEFEAVLDAHRSDKVRYLLSEGRPGEAGEELARFFHRPPLYALLSRLPGRSLAWLIGIRSRLHRASADAES